MRDLRETANTSLLGWYDDHARDLPWRVLPADLRAGIVPDPYRVWLSEIMLQQTAVVAVIPYFERFTRRWPDVCSLAGAADAEIMAAWAGLGYYARARNLLKCARVVADDLAGRFPATEAGLRALPGIGPYTAAAIAAIAFDQPATVVDGNVERVVARLFKVVEPLPGAKRMLRGFAATLTPAQRPGDFAQAMMDLGATVCTTRAPECGACPLAGGCAASATGIAGDLPKRERRAVKPVRHGVIYYAEREDGALLLETRPAEGLLGGMTGFPTSEWVQDAPREQPPITADWAEIAGEVRHTFTHFHLILKVRRALVDRKTEPLRGGFVAHDAAAIAALPTLMRKVHALVAGPA